MRRAALIILLFASCRGGAAPPRGKDMPDPAVRFETSRGPWVVRVEVARTDPEREKGLMFRTELPRDRGMLFVFEDLAEHTFWMRNTLIPLDMIFIAEDRSVVGIVANAQPRTDTARTVRKPSRYVVEVSGGEAAAHGVAPGTRATFIDVPE
jgi:uncharacterized protein